MPRDRDVVAVASATSTGLLERAGPISQAVSGATVTRPSPSSLYRKGSDNSARLEHLILFDRRREAEHRDSMPPRSPGARPLAGQGTKPQAGGRWGHHHQLPPDGISTQLPHREPRSGGADGGGGAVGDDLGEAVAEVGGVEAHAEDGVAAELLGVGDQPLEGRMPCLVDDIGEFPDLTGAQRLEAAGKAPGNADAAHDQPPGEAEGPLDRMAGQVEGGRGRYRRRQIAAYGGLLLCSGWHLPGTRPRGRSD